MGATKNAIIEESEKAAAELTAKILNMRYPRLYETRIERLIADRVQQAFERVLFPGAG